MSLPPSSLQSAGPTDHEISGATATDDAPPSDLIGAIYDSALDPRLWRETLRAVTGFVGGWSGSIFAKDLSGKGGFVFHTDGVGVAPDYVASYFTTYATMDPSNAAHVLAPIDEVVMTADAVDLDEFKTSRMWHEWSAPQAIADMIVAPIERRGTKASLFGIFRREVDGFADAKSASRLRGVVPHIRRAFLIEQNTSRVMGAYANLTEVLDGLSAAIMLADSAGRVVHANHAALEFLGRTRLDPHLSLSALGARGGSDLARAVTGAESGATAAASVTIRGPDGRHWVAHVLPLTDGARLVAGERHDAIAAIFIKPASVEAPSTPELLARTFGLTPGELRVLTTIVDVGGVPDTAEALGIGEATVKTHLHRVFGKTETRRQADLVRLVAAFASPLAV